MKLAIGESARVALLAEGTSPNALAFRYANGVTVRLELPAGEINGGAIFVGEKGRIEITRNNFRTDPAGLIKEVPPKEEVDKWQRAQWQAQYHMQEWVDCMKSRAKRMISSCVSVMPPNSVTLPTGKSSQ